MVLNYFSKFKKIFKYFLRKNIFNFLLKNFFRNNSNASDDTIYLNDDVNINCSLIDGIYISYNNLERFAFSHALAASVENFLIKKLLNNL